MRHIAFSAIALLATGHAITQSVAFCGISAINTSVDVKAVVPSGSSRAIRRIAAVNTARFSNADEVTKVQIKRKTTLNSVVFVDTKKCVKGRFTFAKCTSRWFTFETRTCHLTIQTAATFNQTASHLIWIPHCLCASACANTHYCPTPVLEPNVTSNSKSPVLYTYRVKLFNSCSETSHGLVTTYFKPFAFSRTSILKNGC